MNEETNKALSNISRALAAYRGTWAEHEQLQKDFQTIVNAIPKEEKPTIKGEKK